MEKIFDVEARRRIFDMIRNHPGLHLRELSRRLDILPSLADYHLKALKKNDLVYFNMEEGYKRYYVSENLRGETHKRLTSRQREVLNIVRQKVPLRIVMIILDNPNATHSEILSAVDISASTLSYHLKKLVKARVLKKQSTGRGRGFEIFGREEVLRVLIIGEVKPPSPAEGFIKTWEDFYF